MRVWIISCLITFLIITGIFVKQYTSLPQEVIIPIRDKIEQAIGLKSSEEGIRFEEYISEPYVEVHHFSCNSQEQFILLSSKEEKVFTWLKLEKYKTTLKKIYLSLITYNLGITYEEEYSYSEKGFDYKIERYDSQKIIFRKDINLLSLRILFSMLGFTVILILGRILIPSFRG